MFLNLTPHDINVYNENFELIMTIPSHGNLRLKEKIISTDIIEDNIKVVQKKYKEYKIDFKENFPKLEDSNIYVIVSSIVLQQIKSEIRKMISLEIIQKDINNPKDQYNIYYISPDTGQDSVIRDTNDKIIGIRRFMTL